jgi:hypothetical protein
VNNIKIFQEKTGKKLIPDAEKNILHKICGIIEVNAMTVNLSNGSDRIVFDCPIFGTFVHAQLLLYVRQQQWI